MKLMLIGICIIFNVYSIHAQTPLGNVTTKLEALDTLQAHVFEHIADYPISPRFKKDTIYVDTTEIGIFTSLKYVPMFRRDSLVDALKLEFDWVQADSVFARLSKDDTN
jgi:hypothetical protein